MGKFSVWEHKPELLERLKELWPQGMSCEQIARALGNGITRCSVIGKAARLGLTGRAAPRAPRPRMTKPAIRSAAPRVALPPAPVPMEPVISDDGQPITIMLVSDRHCRYPMDESGADTVFCGRPPKPGSRYCPGHHRICHVPPNAKPPESAAEQSDAAERASGIRGAFG